MKTRSVILKILMPLVLGAGILYWMYRGEDWQTILHVMTDEMDWTWMLLLAADARAGIGWKRCAPAHFRIAP